MVWGGWLSMNHSEPSEKGGWGPRSTRTENQVRETRGRRPVWLLPNVCFQTTSTCTIQRACHSISNTMAETSLYSLWNPQHHTGRTSLMFLWSLQPRLLPGTTAFHVNCIVTGKISFNQFVTISVPVVPQTLVHSTVSLPSKFKPSPPCLLVTAPCPPICVNYPHSSGN